jgi:hydroxymethylpyrimidine pyrophosphatase-like HAD family hydrolase
MTTISLGGTLLPFSRPTSAVGTKKPSASDKQPLFFNTVSQKTSAVITDLDDTLLPKNSQQRPYLPTATHRYLALNAKEGLPRETAFIASTGRTESSVGRLAAAVTPETLDSIRPLDALIVNNGTTLYINDDHSWFHDHYKNSEFLHQVSTHTLPSFIPYTQYLAQNNQQPPWDSVTVVQNVIQQLRHNNHKTTAVPYQIETVDDVTLKRLERRYNQQRPDSSDFYAVLKAVPSQSESASSPSAELAIVFLKDGANAVDTKPLILPYAVLKPDSEARTPVSVEAFEAVEQLVTQAYNTVKQTLYPAMHVSVSQKWLANTEGEIPVSVASRSYVEATPYDKGKAIEALLATYLPKVERVVTLGDANNDAEALSTLEFPRPTDNPLFPDIIPNYAVAMLLPENKNRRF